MDCRNEDWVIEQETTSADRNDFNESIFSMGNGYMGCRGFNEEDSRPNHFELCVFIAGLFDYINPRLTDMANTPNFWKTTIRINGKNLDWKDLTVTEYRKTLHMDQGLIRRSGTFVCETGEQTRFETVKFLHLQHVHQAFLSISLTPLNYYGIIEFETGIDTKVSNRIIQDDQMLDDVEVYQFLRETSRSCPATGPCTVTMSAKSSNITLCEGFDLEFLEDGHLIPCRQEPLAPDGFIGRHGSLDAERLKTYTMNKFVSVWTSRDARVEDLQNLVCDSLSQSKKAGFDAMIDQQMAAWQARWQLADIEIEGDPKAQQALRFNIYQLIQTASLVDSRVSIGARGIMHSRYKGCYCWDTEIFMTPFFLMTQPQVARNLLLYRYHTLDGARRNAVAQNAEGARYAWMSSIDGSEQCESWDIGLCEVHITADVAYAISLYYEATKDWTFMQDAGVEILIETARYWGSRFTYDKQSDRYNLLFVKGPNEYGGVGCNNTYTVMMALYNMKLAGHFASLLKQTDPEKYRILCDKIQFRESEENRWREIKQKAVVLYLPERHLYVEDENYFKTEPLDVKAFKEGDVPLYKKICFDRLQRYRVLKQSDVILLMLLLPDQFTVEEKEAAWEEYEPITTHDSSLSFGTHAEMAAFLGYEQQAFDYFTKSVGIDLYDLMSNTGREGLHFASMGAGWQAAVKGFAGFRIRNDRIALNPKLPAAWQRMALRIKFQGCVLKLVIRQEGVTVSLESGALDELTIDVNGQPYSLNKFQPLAIPNGTDQSGLLE